MAILILLFAVTFLVILLCVGLGFSFFKSRQKNQIRTMLRNAETSSVEAKPSRLLRPVNVEDSLTKFLRRFQFMSRMDLMLDQAGQNWTASKLVTVSCVLSGFSALLGFEFHLALNPEVMALLGGAAGLCLPTLFVLWKRKKSIKAFEEQLPEALDFLSRSMRAGHGFTVALEMLATDSPEPLCSAFRRVSNDLQLGSSLDNALGKLTALVPLVDVRFFVSSVLLQQETGGNLGEILTKLSQIIRERFRLKGQVKAVSAHGRITGLILLLMPLAVTGFMMVSNPGYLTDFAANPVGRGMIWGAIGGQVVGYFVIKKIIDIKV